MNFNKTYVLAKTLKLKFYTTNTTVWKIFVHEVPPPHMTNHVYANVHSTHVKRSAPSPNSVTHSTHAKVPKMALYTVHMLRDHLHAQMAQHAVHMLRDHLHAQNS